MTITTEEFLEKMERRPDNDDMARVNCVQVGTPGHLECGWCPLHDTARFECRCIPLEHD